MSSISDILAGIEAKADWIKRDGIALADYVARLPFQHDFETKAEEAMDIAERELIAALQRVRKARAAFNAKPLERRHAA